MTQSPEQGGGCHCLQTFWRSIDSRVFHSWLPGPGSRLSCPFPSTQPVVRSPSRRRSPAAHRPRHSPKVDAARPPASALPLPRLSSLRSFPHARTAAARSFVSRCRVQTVPRYSAHSPPTACAPRAIGKATFGWAAYRKITPAACMDALARPDAADAALVAPEANQMPQSNAPRSLCVLRHRREHTGVATSPSGRGTLLAQDAEQPELARAGLVEAIPTDPGAVSIGATQAVSSYSEMQAIAAL